MGLVSWFGRPAAARPIDIEALTTQGHRIDATLMTANYKCPELVYNLLASFLKTNSALAVDVCVIDNSTDDRSERFFATYGIPFINRFTVDCGVYNREHDHSGAVRQALRTVTTRYMILCDSDIEFKADISGLFGLFDAQTVAVGQHTPDIHRPRAEGGTQIIAQRLDPAFCIIDVALARSNNLYFNSDSRHMAEDALHPVLRPQVTYDVGSQFFEGIQSSGLTYQPMVIDEYATHFFAVSRRSHQHRKKKILNRIRKTYRLAPF